MQKIKLFSQYNTGALFLKANKELEDQVSQWPVEYLTSEQIGRHRESLKNRHRISLPDIHFANGRQILMERIFPLSVYQPGMKPNVKVRVNVLYYEYPFNGALYLLGCRPSAVVPEPPGEWFADVENQKISIEYIDYEKNPRKTMVAHQKYAASLQQCYEALQQEMMDFNESLDQMIENAVTQRLIQVNEMKRIMSLLT